MELENDHKQLARFRVSRIIRGETDPRDLDQIYLWLRSRSFGLGAVKDLGDFVAHADEKDRGLVWDKASLISKVIRYKLPRIMKNQEPGEQELRQAKDAIIAAFDLDEAASIKKNFRVGQKRAKKILIGVLSKLHFVGGKYQWNNVTSLERRFYDHYSKVLIVREAFSQNTLVSQLAECLIRNGVLAKSDCHKIDKVADFIGLHALAAMHLCTIIIHGEVPCKLQISIDNHKDEKPWSLKINCIIPILDSNVINKLENGEEFSISFSIFSTDCDTLNHTSPELLERFGCNFWDIPVELNINKILTSVF